MGKQTPTKEPVVVAPPQDLEKMLDLKRFLEQNNADSVLLGPDGEQQPLPLEIYNILKQVVDAMQHGESISIEYLDRQLTTQQAADLLGVSRSTLVRLLDKSELPYERPSGSKHRRLRLNDVLAYRERKRIERHDILDELTRQSQEDGLYDVDPAAYQEALKRIRKA